MRFSGPRYSGKDRLFFDVIEVDRCPGCNVLISEFTNTMRLMSGSIVCTECYHEVGHWLGTPNALKGI